MKFTPLKINTFLLFKLPSAYFTGVRLKSISENKTVAVVKFRWVNQNPFKSMFWAVQGIASELTTGVLVMREIAKSGKKISMLVTNMNGTFHKKAVGKIRFECNNGSLIKEAIEKTIATGEGQTIIMTSEGYNEDNVMVSRFEYEWSIKIKS